MPTIERRGITLIGITFSNLLGDHAVQMALPFDGASSSAIDTTLDDVRERFGSKSVTRGVLLDVERDRRYHSSPTDADATT